MATIELIVAVIAVPATIACLVMYLRSRKDVVDASVRADKSAQDCRNSERKSAQLLATVAKLESERGTLSDSLKSLTVRLNSAEERLKPLTDIAAAIGAQKALLDVDLMKVAEVRAQLTALQASVVGVEEEKDRIDVAYYTPTLRHTESATYRSAIDANNDRQKAMIREGTAASCSKSWTVGGDAKAGDRMVKALTKLALRAFNGESDAAIGRVTWKNLAVMKSRIAKSYELINDLVEHWHIAISKAFLDLKQEELQLTYEQEEIIQREREEQRSIREQMRDEERAQRESEQAKLEAEREERRAGDALEKARRELAKLRDEDKASYAAKIAELEARLDEAHKQSQRAISQAQLTKLGHVYIISNPGSFGPDVFKVGMTRRLVPHDRIDELGDASVPFEFDVHALIRTEDAPKLEAELHRRFAHDRINLINLRKEFFRVTMAEIQAACQDLGVTASLTLIAEAKEFRQSQSIRAQLAESALPAAPRTNT